MNCILYPYLCIIHGLIYVYMNAYIVFLTVASRNNDRTVSGKAYAWRLLGMMPAISKAATVAQTP